MQTPSNANPDGDCPHGYEKITDETNNENINTGSLNIGAMYLCVQRGGTSPVTELTLSVPSAAAIDVQWKPTPRATSYRVYVRK